MNKRLIGPVLQLVGFAALTLGGIKVLMPPKAPPDPQIARRRAILQTAAARKFDLPDVFSVVRPFAFNSTKDGNAGDLYLQALKAHYTEPGVKSAFDRAMQAQGPSADAARRQAAAELFASKPVKLLEQAIQFNRCSMTIDVLPVKSLLDMQNSVSLPAQLLGGYVDILALKGDSYAQAGRKDFQKLYYQAGLTIGAHLTQDWSPAAQLAGLTAVVDSLKRLQSLAEAARDSDMDQRLQTAVSALGTAYKQETLEEILILAGSDDGIRALEGWLSQPSFQHAYGFWTTLAALTQWSPEEFRVTGPSDVRRSFLQGLAQEQEPHLAKLGQLAGKDLATLAQKWATLASADREGFAAEIQPIPLRLADPLVQGLYGAPLSLVPSPAAGKAP
jgi:hypothetical protein